MTPAEPTVILHHGTTLARARRIEAGGPDVWYREPGDLTNLATEGFSTWYAGRPSLGLGTPVMYAEGKARNFPREGGPALLEIEVPTRIVELVSADDNTNEAALSGDVRFRPGAGIEELRAVWPHLTKRVIPL